MTADADRIEQSLHRARIGGGQALVLTPPEQIVRIAGRQSDAKRSQQADDVSSPDHGPYGNGSVGKLRRERDARVPAIFATVRTSARTAIRTYAAAPERHTAADTSILRID